MTKQRITVVSKYSRATDSNTVVNVSNLATTALGQFLSPANRCEIELWGERFTSLASLLAWLRWGDVEPKLNIRRVNRRIEEALLDRYGLGRKLNFKNLQSAIAYATALKIIGSDENFSKAAQDVKSLDFFYVARHKIRRPWFYQSYAEGVALALSGVVPKLPGLDQMFYPNSTAVQVSPCEGAFVG